MDKNRLRCLRSRKQTKFTRYDSEEVSCVEWKFVNMTEQEEDLIFRMYRLVGNSLMRLYDTIQKIWWDLIARRVVGREANEIERYWLMKNCDYFSNK